MESKIHNEKLRRRLARRGRVTKRVARSTLPRLTIFRSSKHIYAQIVDAEGRTIATASTRSKTLRDEGHGGNVDAAKRVGQKVAELARDKQIEKVVFNRNGFLYHGRVKALAEAAREAGLQF